MRAILIDRKGFRSETDLSKKLPAYEVISVPSLDFNREVKIDEVVVYERCTFYFVRSFLDEFDRETFIYKER